MADAEAFIAFAREHNPDIKFLFTVSPVPLTATASANPSSPAPSPSTWKTSGARTWPSGDRADHRPGKNQLSHCPAPGPTGYQIQGGLQRPI